MCFRVAREVVHLDAEFSKIFMVGEGWEGRWH